MTIPEGSYTYDDWTATASTDPSRMFSGNVTWVKGDFWNGKKHSIAFGARVRPNARLNAEVSFARDDVDLATGAFIATVSRLRVNYAFSTRAFVDAFVQYNSEDRRVSTNVRFNLIHRPLSDIFVVYTEDRPTYGRAETSHVLVLKYSHLLAF